MATKKIVNEWAIADEISDRIVDLINERLETMRQKRAIAPLQLLAGQLLGLMATFRTIPFGSSFVPAPLLVLRAAVGECLSSLRKEMK